MALSWIRSKTIIRDSRCGILYENGVLTRVLPAGRYIYWRWPWSKLREIVQLDLRERSATIKNQEILTADKVAVRLSLLDPAGRCKGPRLPRKLARGHEQGD